MHRASSSPAVATTRNRRGASTCRNTPRSAGSGAWTAPGRRPRTEPKPPIDRIEPADPIDRIEPADPIDRIEPALPTERIDPTEPTERIEAAEPAERMDPADPADRMLVLRGAYDGSAERIGDRS